MKCHFFTPKEAVGKAKGKTSENDKLTRYAEEKVELDLGK